MKLFAGNSNRVLAESVARYLNISLGKASVRRFADQEIFVEIQENVRGQDVFVLQSTSFPANDHLMEMLIMIDAFRRSSAKRITAVIPYFGYARQDRRASGRTPISAKLVSNLITEAGADRVLTLDLHAGQIQGFFDIPTDNLFAVPVMARDVKAHYKTENVMVVSPDVGGVVRARSILNYGQSGDPASPHFFDQAALYARREFKPAWFSREEVEANAVRSYRVPSRD